MYYFFRDKYKIEQPWVRYINPRKQKLVYEMLKDVPSWIEYVIIFGSAVTPNCREDSDLDICVIGDKKEENNIKLWTCLDGVEKDIIYRTSVQDFKESLKTQPFGVVYEIKKSGVIVYEREKNIITAR